MIKLIASKLKEDLSGLSFLQWCAGLTQVAEKETGDSSSTVVRFPISDDYHLGSEHCGTEGPVQDFTINSGLTGLCYMEELFCRPGKSDSVKQLMESGLRIVVWLNPEKYLTGQQLTPFVGTRAQQQVLKTLKDNWSPSPASGITGASYTVSNIIQQDKSIFSKYTYNAAQAQFTLLPYQFFCIDLDIRYYMSLTECGLDTVPGGTLANHTAINYTIGQLQFSGGSPTGETEVYINDVLYYTLPDSVSVWNILFAAGTYQVKWRKKQGETFTEFATQELVVVNSGQRNLRLYPVPGTVADQEALFTFPMQVAQDTPGLVHTFSPLDTAADAQEYMDIWNANSANSLLGQIVSFEYYDSPTLKFWSFLFTPNDNQPLPDYFRGYPL